MEKVLELEEVLLEEEKVELLEEAVEEEAVVEIEVDTKEAVDVGQGVGDPDL